MLFAAAGFCRRQPKDFMKNVLQEYLLSKPKDEKRSSSVQELMSYNSAVPATN
jgi:hypothetical protein